jgi:hypothetical protein
MGAPALIPLLAIGACFLMVYLWPFGAPRDYEEYEAYFDSMREVGLLVTFRETRFEPGFAILAYAGSLAFRESLLAFAVLSSLFAGIKIAVLQSYAPHWWAATVATSFYLVRYLPIHEMTQLRASICAALLLATYGFVVAGRWRTAVVLGGAALLTHMSAVFVLPLMALRVTRRRYLPLLFAVLFLSVLYGLPRVAAGLAGTFQVLEFYEFGAETTSPFAAVVVLDALMIGASLLLWEHLSETMRHVVVMQIGALAFYFALLGAPALAHRIRELVSVFWVIFVAAAWSRHWSVQVATGVFVVSCAGLYTYTYLVAAGGFFGNG